MILSETDGPVTYYGPFKNKPTRPSFIVDVVRKLSEIKNVTVEEVIEIVWRNFHSFMSL